MNDITRSSQFIANSLKVFYITYFRRFSNFFLVFVVFSVNFVKLFSSLRGPIQFLVFQTKIYHLILCRL